MCVCIVPMCDVRRNTVERTRQTRADDGDDDDGGHVGTPQRHIVGEDLQNYGWVDMCFGVSSPCDVILCTYETIYRVGMG